MNGSVEARVLLLSALLLGCSGEGLDDDAGMLGAAFAAAGAPSLQGAAAGAGGAVDAVDERSSGVNDCTLLFRYEPSHPALDTRGAAGGARSLGWGATEVGRVVSPVPVVEGAVVVEAAATVAVDERNPARWPLLWVEGFEEKTVPVAGLPRSRFWWDVGSRQRELLVLGAAGLELDGVECSIDVLAVELWDCAP